MKSRVRIESVAKGAVDRINSLPTRGLDLQDSSLCQAFAIYETLQWVLGRREADREATVTLLLDRYLACHPRIAADAPQAQEQPK